MDCRVVHSQSKPAYNIVNNKLGAKYKIARFPYIVVEDDKEGNHRRKMEALVYANVCLDALNKFDNRVISELPTNAVIQGADIVYSPELIKDVDKMITDANKTIETCHDKGGNCNYPYCTVPDCYEDIIKLKTKD